jgi:hypothetical protein
MELEFQHQKILNRLNIDLNIKVRDRTEGIFLHYGIILVN